jgi:proteasome accessory factor C
MLNQHKILRVLQLITLLKARPAKSIQHLGEILNSSERTVYRYLDLLEELGFSVRRDKGNRVYIEVPAEQGNELYFTTDESRFLHELVVSAGKKNKLRDGILQKLYVNSDIQVGSSLLLKAHLGKIIQTCAEAIQQKKQMLLKKYHSANSNAISNRLVEPIRFTDNYQNIVAFEPATGKNKYFNVERITEAVVTRNSFKHQHEHKYSPPDVFGFSSNGKSYEIDLTLSLRATVILREEYPLTSALIKKEKRGYRFKANVYDLKPVTRFVLGFMGEIKVNGSTAFKKHFKDKLVRMIQ